MPKLPTQSSHFFVFKQAGPISITATEYLQTANSFKLLIHQISSPHTHPVLTGVPPVMRFRLFENVVSGVTGYLN